MKKFLLIIICLLLIGCSKKQMPEVNETITMTDSAKELSNELKIDFNNLKLDVDIIDASSNAFTLYLSKNEKDEEVVSNYNKIFSFIKTFTKKGKIYDYFNKDKEFDETSIDEQTKTITLYAIVKSDDYKITISRMSGLSHKGSEKTYSIYKIKLSEESSK